jgi:acetyltransferase
LALIALTTVDHKSWKSAEARYVIDRDGIELQFAVAVADQWHKRGIGRRLMSALIEAGAGRSIVAHAR